MCVLKSDRNNKNINEELILNKIWFRLKVRNLMWMKKKRLSKTRKEGSLK